MLSGAELKDFRSRRNLSLRDVAEYSHPRITPQMISMVENGERAVIEENHKSIVNGINRAHYAKIQGKFHRDPIQKTKPKFEEVEPSPTTTEEVKSDVANSPPRETRSKPKKLTSKKK